MRSCPSCSSPAADDDRFCGRCGSPLGAERPPVGGRFCTQCGGGLAADARFCGRCGADVAVPAPSEETLPSFPGDRSPEPTGFAREDEDLLAEWEQALRVPASASGRIGDEPAITETIVRPPPAPRTDVYPVISRPAAPAPPVTPLRRKTPAPVTPQPAQRTPFRFPLGATLALIGAVAVILSAVLPWDGSFRGSLPRDIPASLLLDPEASGGVSLGIVLLVAGTVGALVALLTMALPFLKPLRRITGLLTLVLPIGFALRTVEALVTDGGITALWGALGTGVYVAAGGALVELMAGRWFRR
ncbi:MAG: zinc ribbon domain-containing protein [Actinomycetota bacterium]